MSEFDRFLFRRKYRKIMVTFEEKMRESSQLFREEQRIVDISQRIAEQTEYIAVTSLISHTPTNCYCSQLLQLLVDLNLCPQVPPRSRYDLKPPEGRADAKSMPAVAEEDGHLDLRKARHQLQTGELDTAGYREIETALLKTSEFAPSRSYSSLLPLAPPPSQTTEKKDTGNGVSSGFLSIKQEEQYIQGLDAFLDGTASNPRPHAANNLGSRNAEKTTERERETQLKNPVSVYNWLRKHQPQVFLQDNEPSTEKPPRATGSRISTRKSASKEMFKQEPDFYDEDGIAVDVGSSSRGKRKRDNDGGYRPKGGTSRKRRKETKEDSGRIKRQKKMSMDAR